MILGKGFGWAVDVKSWGFSLPTVVPMIRTRREWGGARLKYNQGYTRRAEECSQNQVRAPKGHCRLAAATAAAHSDTVATASSSEKLT